MGLTLSLPGAGAELKPRITVIGVGGAGCNAVNNMIRSNLEGVEFVVANTDAQALRLSQCERRIQLGINSTNGLGAGARPDVGRVAAEECLDVIQDHLQGSNMAFITAGMGGGTGTGGAPVIARVARELGILTVGVVTKPFHFEGAHRMGLAEEGLRDLQEFVDTLIVIPNQNLFRVANEKTTFSDAFKMADNVLYSGVRGVTDLMIMPGLINLDFADIRTVMAEMGKAMMGSGEASGDRRAIEAAEAAISNPLLEDVSMKGAKGLLINITGGLDMTLFEVDEAANRIRDEVDEHANIIFGSTFDQNMEGIMRVSIVATGIDAAVKQNARPTAVNGTTAKATATAPAARKPETAPPVEAPAPQPAPAIPEPAAIEFAATGTDGLAGIAQAFESVVKPAVTSQPHAAAQHPLTPTGRRGGHEPGFVAGRPAEPRVQSRTGGTETAKTGTEKKPAFNLFQRVTGVARQTITGVRSGQASGGQVPVEPTPPPAAAPRQQERGVSPTLAASAPETPKSPPAIEQDVIDIPAFLRRQAN